MRDQQRKEKTMSTFEQDLQSFGAAMKDLFKK